MSGYRSPQNASIFDDDEDRDPMLRETGSGYVRLGLGLKMVRGLGLELGLEVWKSALELGYVQER